MLKLLEGCMKNRGDAYKLEVVIGDCFCPSCTYPVMMHEAVSGNCFYGHCKCGRYIEAEIKLDRDGMYGKWVIIS